jgi:eukaryotic-like serine/threonine-protein kinase
MGDERREVGDVDAHADTSLVRARSSSDETRQGTYLGAQSDKADPSGRVDTERYEAREFIAAGGMGEVWRVHDREMDRLLAMKVLAAPYLNNAIAHARFVNEAQVTAALQHPGIVPLHDLGTLPDGRPYFTMKEVRGQTFLTLIEELHSAAERLSARRGTLRDMVDRLLRVAEAMAYAHSAGVIHRDLKPQNVMVGRFGEVQVMDWGLAIRTGGEPVPSAEVAGTFAYMPPEQARGESLGPPSDVYALGAILYQLLLGAPPYDGVTELHAAVIQGPPTPLAFEGGDLAQLAAIATRAMAREPEERYADAGRFADALRDWQNDTRRRNRGLELVAEADAAWKGEVGDGIAAMRARIAELRREAAKILDDLQPYDSAAAKAPAWRLEDEAHELEHRAAVAEVQWQQRLRSALNEESELDEAHERLANYYKEALDEADAQNDRVAIKRAEALLRIHDRGRYRRHLEAEAQLTVVTSPPGARATLYRFESHARRLVPREVEVLGETPLRQVTLTAGSYLVQLDKEGHHPVRYPVHLARAGAWTGVAPGDDEPFVVGLPEVGELAEEEALVPAGYFVAGGDARAVESAPRARPWVDAFVIQRFSVTRGDYVAFLNQLLDDGHAEEAQRRAPKRTGQREALAWPMRADGRFQLDPAVDAPSQARWPITNVDWTDARAYAAWWSACNGHDWRLPTELEWEKAARGVDGRRFPWGDHFDATFACVAESHRDEASLQPVDSYPADCSVYGVRGMAGNTRDWCLDVYRRHGARIEAGRAVVEHELTAQADQLRSARGGSWHTSGELVGCASRFVGKPDFFYRGLGFRLVRSG